LTCDIDEGSVKVAQSYFARSDYQHKIEQRICKANVVIEECYSKEETFDIIFIDADKKMYLEYLKRVLNFDGREKRSLLNDGGLIIVDNTLWKGLVMNNVSTTTILLFVCEHMGCTCIV
jgi:caffeoyl-CoA O-methyltransferase